MLAQKKIPDGQKEEISQVGIFFSHSLILVALTLNLFSLLSVCQKFHFFFCAMFVIF